MLAILTLPASTRVKKGDGTVRPVCGDHFMEPGLSRDHRGPVKGTPFLMHPWPRVGGGEGVHAEMEAGSERGGDSKE